MTEKRFVKELVEYAKGNKEWENIVDEDGTDGYKITEDGRLVVIHEEDADHYTAKMSIDSMNFDLCGMTALERKIDVILRFFYTEVTKEMIKEYMKEEVIDYCPGCNVAYCQGRYTTGQCE